MVRIVLQRQLKHRILAGSLSFILTVCLAIAIMTLGLSNAVYAQSAQEPNLTETPSVSARDAFREAYENRYTWDNLFPGYSAEVLINYQGQLTQGIVRIKPDLNVDVLNIKKEEVRQLVANQLRMEVIHRRRVPFEKRHGHNSFELEGTDKSGALKIKEVGDKMNSHYKVQDKVITQVNRNVGEDAVTVDTLGTAQHPQGYLVTHFQVTFRQARTGKVIETQDVRDVHKQIGKYYLLTYRVIHSAKVGNLEAQQDADILIRFNAVQLLRFANDLVSPV